MKSNLISLIIVLLSFTISGLAETISLNGLDLAKVPEIEQVFRIVGIQGDSLKVNDKNINISDKRVYLVTAQECCVVKEKNIDIPENRQKKCLYLIISLHKHGLDILYDSEPDPSLYAGYYKTGGNTFVFEKTDFTDSLLITSEKAEIPIKKTFPRPDGSIYWRYVIFKGKIHKIDFQYEW